MNNKEAKDKIESLESQIIDLRAILLSRGKLLYPDSPGVYMAQKHDGGIDLLILPNNKDLHVLYIENDQIGFDHPFSKDPVETLEHLEIDYFYICKLDKKQLLDLVEEKFA